MTSREADCRQNCSQLSSLKTRTSNLNRSWQFSYWSLEGKLKDKAQFSTAERTYGGENMTGNIIWQYSNFLLNRTRGQRLAGMNRSTLCSIAWLRFLES